MTPSAADFAKGARRTLGSVGVLLFFAADAMAAVAAVLGLLMLAGNVIKTKEEQADAERRSRELLAREIARRIVSRN